MIKKFCLFVMIGLAFVLLAACAAAPTPTAETIAPTETATRVSPTDAPTQTPKPTATPLPDHLDWAYISMTNLLYDKTEWTLTEKNSFSILAHNQIEGCQVGQLPTYPLPQIDERLGKYLGNVNWRIEVLHISTKIGVAYYMSHIDGYKVNFDPMTQEECLGAFEQMIQDSNFGVIEDPQPTPTPFVFDCPHAPKSRLRVGDGIVILSKDNVRLRSTPEKYADNVIASLPQCTFGEIIDGPVCHEYNPGIAAYVYWKIRTDDGEEGWMAEGDAREQFIGLDQMAGEGGCLY